MLTLWPPHHTLGSRVHEWEKRASAAGDKWIRLLTWAAVVQIRLSAPGGRAAGTGRVGQMARLDLATLVGYPFSSPQHNQAEFHVLLQAFGAKTVRAARAAAASNPRLGAQAAASQRCQVHSMMYVLQH